ncbi:precorrin-6A/cobalt-precorrin-6A reductase [Sulfitobacter donghicola]|uniref:Precorrin-6x reductase n=1 Tax=Sulfitobacter donghicola DSW-25 = KCTC 12864 = JCM 14565 TaxID=1300350 RepID=A0A073IGW0_9RHOB|nr:precorrin-6A/cobalt-precorrin-6A reductase [Sulfitobacter donghicola]KEJ89543.1 precorrin-6x reductase [Sulfitobacter donghicola DSW-25 = KCTC 12864 = JCM 14565]KIN69368.1 Precorrin-6A reductase [Sulfitobacter donghicola DSW-25 = KCTC 12864 = JCM 14565]
MGNDAKILLLAGSFEARRMAEALTEQGAIYDAWISEAPRGDARMPQTPRLHRFETATEMRDAVEQGGYTAVLDASHAFDRTVTQQGFAAAKALGLPYLRLERPDWSVDGHSNWRRAPDVAAANDMIAQGATVFCATGWDSLPDFVGFRGKKLLLRQTRRHDRPPPYPFVQLVFGDPPFSARDEETLFQNLSIDLLICRNLGGRASRPKLDAAEALGIPVILIDRPLAPEGLPSVAEIADALAWTAAL